MYQRLHGAAAEVPRATVRIRRLEPPKTRVCAAASAKIPSNPPTGTHPAHGAALAPVNHPAASDDES